MRWLANFIFDQEIIQKNKKSCERVFKIFKENDKWIYARMNEVVLYDDENKVLITNLIRAKIFNIVLNNIKYII